MQSTPSAPRLTAIAMLLAIAGSPASTAAVSADCSPSSAAVISRTLVYSGPDSVSKFYRIPALAVAPDGTLVAVADRRIDSNQDLPGRIDVVERRSTDNGITWTDATVVAAHDDGGGYGDPALGVSADGHLVAVMTHGNGLWESTPSDHAYIYTCRSTDNGATWSVPADITGSLFAPDDSAPVKAVTAFATSGHIATLPDGTMMFCLVTRPDEKKWGQLRIYPVKSTDGGRSWQIIPVAVDDDADESKIAALTDGSLLMSIRNRRQGYRKFSRSTDGGHTWTPVELSTTLPDPACNGDIISYRRGPTTYLLHSVPDSHNRRTDVSLFASADDGRTWRKLITLCPAPSVYSALAELPDGTLGCLTEEHSSEGGQRIWFTRLDIGALIDKHFAR